MKICLVLHGFPPELQGGTESTVEALALAMQEAGHEVLLVCGSLQGGSPQTVQESVHRGLRVLRVPRDDLYYEHWYKAYHPGVAQSLRQIFQAEQPDVVHVQHWLRLTSNVGRLARMCGAKVVITMHDYFAPLARVVRRMGEDEVLPPEAPMGLPPFMNDAEVAEAFAHHRADLQDELAAAHLLLAPSAAHAQGLQAMALADLGPITVAAPPLLAPPTLPSAATQSAAASQPSAASQPRGQRLVTWGALYPDKGLESVLDAMRAVWGEWSLDVWGEAADPKYLAELHRLARGIEVNFHGAFPSGQLQSLQGDYAILPSLCHESYGLVLDEALALGLPVIASDIPAYRERGPEASCAFYPAGDAASLTMLMLEEKRLADLQAPAPPKLQTAAQAAAELVQLYGDLKADAGAWSGPSVDDEQRALHLFRRAERRFWSMLQAADPALPPEDYLS